MKTKIALALVMAISLTFSAVYAQKPGYRDNHDDRNRYGYNKKHISKSEARRLEYKRRELQRDIRRAKCNDGRISRAERSRIERDWRAMNRDVYHYKNNDRSR